MNTFAKQLQLCHATYCKLSSFTNDLLTFFFDESHKIQLICHKLFLLIQDDSRLTRDVKVLFCSQSLKSKTWKGSSHQSKPIRPLLLTGFLMSVTLRAEPIKMAPKKQTRPHTFTSTEPCLCTLCQQTCQYVSCVRKPLMMSAHHDSPVRCWQPGHKVKELQPFL